MENVFSADKPLSDPSHDLLNYAPFAKHLAESIFNIPVVEGFVIGLYGEWGSGKTTLLNFVIEYLKEFDTNKMFDVVHFNPWWLSTQEELTYSFFSHLQLALGKSLGKELLKRLGLFVRLLSRTPQPLQGLVEDASERISESLEKDLPTTKQEISDALANANRKILIVIDDIDRLSSDEIRQLFRLIKTVADFPNVAYLVAFAKDVVVKSLKGVQHGFDGDQYLEKIVQVSFDIPLPEGHQLEKILLERLNVVLDDTPPELIQNERWNRIYNEGIKQFISTPRTINRLVNSLLLNYQAVKSEVNAIDFIGIETLRVFCPIAHKIIQQNSEQFMGSISDISRDREIATLTAFHDSWMQKISAESRQPIKSILVNLFPKLTSIWREFKYEPYDADWRKLLRISDSERFSVYFRLSLGDAIPYTEFRLLLGILSDRTKFQEQHNHDQVSEMFTNGTRQKGEQFLNWLIDFVEEVDDDNIAGLLTIIFDSGDTILQPAPRREDFVMDRDIYIGYRILYDLVSRFDRDKRFEIIEQMASNGQAISLIVACISAVNQAIDEQQSEEFLTNEQMDNLRQITVARIEDVSNSDKLLESPILRNILIKWNEWGNEENAALWVSRIVASDDNLSVFLKQFLKIVPKYVIGSDQEYKYYLRLDPAWLEPFIDPNILIDRARNLKSSLGLDEVELRAVEKFVSEFDTRMSGQNPNFPPIEFSGR